MATDGIMDYEEYGDWVDSEPTIDGAHHWNWSPYRHRVRFHDGTVRFAIGWCPECQQWEKRDYWSPSTHRWLTTASVPTTGGWHPLMDYQPAADPEVTP